MQLNFSSIAMQLKSILFLVLFVLFALITTLQWFGPSGFALRWLLPVVLS